MDKTKEQDKAELVSRKGGNSAENCSLAPHCRSPFSDVVSPFLPGSWLCSVIAHPVSSPFRYALHPPPAYLSKCKTGVVIHTPLPLKFCTAFRELLGLHDTMLALLD